MYALDVLLTYRNEKVLARYAADYPDAKLNADEAFVEFMKYIWLCYQHEADKKSQPENTAFHFKCVIHTEMKEIDNMWHTFLLFTRDYQQFCREYLHGDFFHHEPLSTSIENFYKDTYQAELARYLSYIYDKLGENSLLKWFDVAIKR